MKAPCTTSSSDDDDDADDRRSAIVYPPATDASSPTERRISSPSPRPLKRATGPLLLKSRIHAGGVPVVHELGRGVPGFWGPPASEVAQLYAALREVQP